MNSDDLNLADYRHSLAGLDLKEWEIRRVGRGGTLFLLNVRTGVRRQAPRDDYEETHPDPRLLHPLGED